jgi:hypothetical protein
MARSTHATYTAADRFERKERRKQRPKTRRASTRRQILDLAIAEVI